MSYAQKVLAEIIDSLQGKLIDDSHLRTNSVFNILESHKVAFNNNGVITFHEHTPGIKVRDLNSYEVVQDGFNTVKEAETWLEKQLNEFEPGSDYYHRNKDSYEFIGVEIKPSVVLYQYNIVTPICFSGHADLNKQNLSPVEIAQGLVRSVSSVNGTLRFKGYSLDYSNGSKFTELNEPQLVTSLKLTDGQASELAYQIAYIAFTVMGFQAFE